MRTWSTTGVESEARAVVGGGKDGMIELREGTSKIIS